VLRLLAAGRGGHCPGFLVGDDSIGGAFEARFGNVGGGATTHGTRASYGGAGLAAPVADARPAVAHLEDVGGGGSIAFGGRSRQW
jgi:hypothetical protein